MRNLRRYLIWPVLTLLVLTSAALAQNGEGYNLTWWTVDSGGTTFSASVDGRYTLGSTIGQPDAGVMGDSGGTYTLSGGFWVGAAAAAGHELFLPLLLRGYP